MEEKKSILDMAMGAVQERVTMVMQDVVNNVMDPNTRADKKRVITVQIEFLPNSKRSDIRVSSTVKAKLEPTEPIMSTFALGANQDGEFVAAEMTNNIPGQVGMDGREQESGIVIPLHKIV